MYKRGSYGENEYDNNLKWRKASASISKTIEQRHQHHESERKRESGGLEANR